MASNDSNDSNEGNDTTGAAFQVGDRVRFDWFGETVEGVVRENCGAWLVVENDARGYSGPRPEACTLISRAPAPASAPAQTVDPIPAMEVAMPAALGEAWDAWREACYCEDVPPAVALITLVHHAAKRGANAAVDMLAPEPDAAATDVDAATAAFENWNPWAEKRPVVVCLCGSTRFSEAFRDANLRETLESRIVLSIGCDMRSDTEIFGGMPQSELDEIKRRLDDLHKRKIDLADEILVLNVGGYVGESTRSEIAYAQAHDKRVRYLETTGGVPTQPGETPDTAAPATPPPAATPLALDWYTPTPLDLVAPHGGAVKVQLRDGRPITGALAIGDATGLTLTTATQSDGDGGLHRWTHVFVPWFNVAFVAPERHGGK